MHPQSEHDADVASQLCRDPPQLNALSGEGLACLANLFIVHSALSSKLMWHHAQGSNRTRCFIKEGPGPAGKPARDPIPGQATRATAPHHLLEDRLRVAHHGLHGSRGGGCW